MGALSENTLEPGVAICWLGPATRLDLGPPTPPPLLATTSFLFVSDEAVEQGSTGAAAATRDGRGPRPSSGSNGTCANNKKIVGDEKGDAPVD